MANIILHQFSGINVGLNKKDGYINATKLCLAYNNENGTNKKPADWTRTDRAKRYIRYVSSVTHLCETDLIVIRQGGLDEQGTWIHPDLAIPLSTWLSVEIEYEVQKVIKNWYQAKEQEKFPEQLTGTIPKNPEIAGVEFISAVIDITMPKLVDELKTGIKLEAISVKFPEYRAALESAKPKLLIESKLLSPKQLGEILEERTGKKHSAIAVNKILAEKGFQRSTGEKNPAWEPIGKGLEYGQLVADTARGHAKTIQHCRWYESVLEQIIES